MYTTIISADTLEAHLSTPNWVIVDTRFDLANSQWGRQAYDAAHIPGAQFLDLNADLAGPLNGRNGRHPLPDITIFAATLSAMGIGAGTQVVVYDQGTAMFVARLWWMLRWLGHDAVAVLDGGYAAWEKESRPVNALKPAPTRAAFAPQVREALRIDCSAVVSGLAQRAHTIIDARGAERYRGDVEPIDAVGGHIPGAKNRPFSKNLDSDGKWRPAAQLRTEFETLLGSASPQHVVHSCGSGVSACANILAMEHAGMQGSQLYAGSWSEWSCDPSRPVEKG
jgi:thiosulfate/3-mercaptopyruvate sulfurtransferase